MFQLFLIYKSPHCFLASFVSIGLWVQEMNRKIDFKDGSDFRYMDAMVTIKMNWAISYLQVTLILPIKCRGNRPFCSGEQVQIDIQDGDGDHIAFPIGAILVIFDLFLIYKSPRNWPLSSGEEAQNGFPRWQPSWVSDPTNFSYFDLHFQDGGHFGFPLKTVLVIFNLQVTPMLHTKFWVSWPFRSGEKATNIFSRWRPFLIETILSFINKSARFFLRSFQSTCLSVQEKK